MDKFTKWFLIFVGFVVGLIVIWWFLFSKPTLSPVGAFQVNECYYQCPVYHFEWNTYSCPDGYSHESNKHPGYCYKGNNPDWPEDYKEMVKTTHSADVEYNKSQDPNKCHRPSDNTLSDKYGMDRNARDEFKKEHDEWVDAQKICPTPTPTEIPEPTDTPEPTPTVEPTPEPTPAPVTSFRMPQGCEGHCTPAGANPPLCTTEPPKAPIATGGFRVDSDTVQVRWFKSTDSIDKYVLVYGMSPDNLEWGVPYIDPNMDYYDLNGVPQGHVWYQVFAERDFCQSGSEITDP